MAYAVQNRTHEIGVRIALGARPHDVLRMILFDGGRLALWGILFGVLGALALTPLLNSLLYGVKPTDRGIFSVAVLLLGAVALLATYIPARRATKVDPAVTLRWE